MFTYCQFHVTFHIFGNFSQLKNSDAVIENKYGLRCSKEPDIIWNPLPTTAPSAKNVVVVSNFIRIWNVKYPENK